MPYLIIGLGNPGEEYAGTRHNTGRMVIQKLEAGDWKLDKKLNALVNKGKIGEGKKAEAVMLVMPETMMNNSGRAVALLIKSKKVAEKLIVVYDDLDLPLGVLKVSYNRGDGGHRGLASIIKALKTREFVRVRVGIAPTTLSGKIKKPNTEEGIIKFILGKFKDSELAELKKIIKKAVAAIGTIVTEGRERAMGEFNK